MKKAFIILLAGMVACNSSKQITKTEKPAEISPELAAAQVKVPGITMDQLTHGSQVYAQSCARCHSLKDPANYTMQRWDPILRNMFVKARVSDVAQQTLIRDYVMAKSKS